MTEQLKYVDLNQNDMVMILGALLTIKSALPDNLENEPEIVQVKAAQLLHLIERFKQSLKITDEQWADFGSLFNVANTQKGQQTH